jgi:hypothetical protein
LSAAKDAAGLTIRTAKSKAEKMILFFIILLLFNLVYDPLPSHWKSSLGKMNSIPVRIERISCWIARAGPKDETGTDSERGK